MNETVATDVTSSVVPTTQPVPGRLPKETASDPLHRSSLGPSLGWKITCVLCGVGAFVIPILIGVIARRYVHAGS